MATLKTKNWCQHLFWLKILTKFIFCPFNLKIIRFSSRLYFIHILVSQFRKAKRKLLNYSEGGRVIEWPHFINGFYSTRKIQLRSFKTLILFEKINWG
jgi:hypothetical protein